MKVAFVTELPFHGKIAAKYPNMRTEFAWMHALDAVHHNIHTIETIRDYDHVFVIVPKGKTFLSAEGSKLSNDRNPISNLLDSNIVQELKQVNKKVYFVQEGPHWWFNDYELKDQINHYNLIASCDAIFAHNESDVLYYKGMFPNKPVHTLPSLMIEDLVKDIDSDKQNKVIIGGNFARWYGGFESYNVASVFELPVWGQTSHATRENEDQIIHQLPRVPWMDWINQLSTFRFAVHLMPTVAAGTFALNCAYLGIPCIGNKNVDTQRLCHPALSVDVNDIQSARECALALRNDFDFYQKCSKYAKANYRTHYSLEVWKEKMNVILNETK